VKSLLSDLELLRRLVACDTTSAKSNLELIDLVCEYLDRPGVRLERLPSPDGRKANLLAWIGPEPGADRAGLILSGHTDVVPAGEPEWESDPFTLSEHGDRLYARGACDMKGFLAVAANCAARAAAGAATVPLRAPLVLLFTYDEELGTLGAQQLVRDWPSGRPLPRAAVIGEPTSLSVVRLHKGHLKLRVQVGGRSAHSSLPHLGRNAVEAAGQVIQALARLRRKLEAERPAHHQHFPEVPFAALNVAKVEGGVAINIVPDRATIDLGVRLLPGMESAAMVERVRAAINAARPDGQVEVSVLSDSPPMLCPEDSPAARALSDLLGQRATIGASYASDAGPLQSLGVEAVLWGPGSIEVAHRPNEFLPRAEMERAAALLPTLVERLCGAGE